MKKTDKNGETSKNKACGLPINENDVAASVIGGIVEKGFINQTVSQPPQLTVLPFPVARHRSHGPHWGPRGSGVSRRRGKDEEEDGEDEDFMDFDRVAAEAVPVKRKEKKGLDFKDWKKLADGGVGDVFSKNEGKVVGNGNGNGNVSGVTRELESMEVDVVQRREQELDDSVMRSAIKAKKTSYDDVPVGVGMGQGGTSMESEIDAENRAWLDKMSTDEIAEAQAELMKKMSPDLIKILQRRGHDKTRPSSSVSSSAVGSFAEAVDGKDGEVTVQKTGQDKTRKSSSISSSAIGSFAEAVGDKVEKVSISYNDPSMANPNHKHIGLESKDVPETKSLGSTLWDAWSTRVEAARDLRYSLDGDVVNDHGQLPGGVENASERDFIRTEGDPGALGYTIKEALALTRSVVPGQRALGLHLIESVLYKAQYYICRNQTGSTLKVDNQKKTVDWEALWAFALGPEPELALSLRMCIDDNHNSVVLACARVMQCVLSFDYNELFFDISEKTGIYEKDVCTAPIFRSRPKIEVGFLHGGFWKYNTKPSNIFPFDKVMRDDEGEEEHTIKDDIVVATQDVAAGLVRMGILPRIRYLLESDPSAALEDCLISILVAIARHSPTCADAVIKCERLLQVIVHRFTTKDQMGVDFSKIKSIILLRVLARSDKKRCMEFVDNGIFQKLTWHLYRSAFSQENFLNIETEKFKLLSALLVEQLRFWKVAIQYGYCVSYFSDLFPALYIWLDVPSFDNLIEKNILHNFMAITKEAYLVTEALTRTLPNFYSQNIDQNDTETWRWSHVGPMIDLALKWVSLKSDPFLSSLLSASSGAKIEWLTSLLWVISAVIRFLLGVLRSVVPDDNSNYISGNLPWLPEFVPKIGLQIIKNGHLSFAQVKEHSFLEYLCEYRHQSDQETSLASVCCLNGLIEVVVSVNNLIQLAKTETMVSSIDHSSVPSADKVLTDGILKCSISEMTTLLTTFMMLTSSSGQLVQSVEAFGRGGPAPGVGVGWGGSGGGLWSLNILVTQMDARLVLKLLEIFLVESTTENPTNEDINIIMERINCAFELCLVMGPRDGMLMEKVLDILLQPKILKYLDIGMRRSLTFGWQYTEEEYSMCSDYLISHFKNRWLHVKKSDAKIKDRDGRNGTSKKSKFSLETIQEDVDTLRNNSLVTEWAHQRLPLPSHWFLSPITTIDYTKVVNLPLKPNFPEVARCGLFFILGLEAMSSQVSSASIDSVPVIWKLHALSVTLFAGMDILEEEKSRDAYSNLQMLYGNLLDKKLLEVGRNNSVDLLKFDKEIHDSYTTFIETIVENFAGVSYGDLLYGRQMSIYLHRCVGASVRLAAWNALSNIRALELLPSLDKCLAQEEGYLEPLEEDEMILDAYVKSWVSGALDRSATRRSVAFTLVIHHLSYFIFGDHTGDKKSLRDRLAKSILRDYSRKSDHEGMMVKLIQYKKPEPYQNLDQAGDTSLQGPEIARRLTVLKEACEGNSTLLNVVAKVKNAILKEP